MAALVLTKAPRLKLVDAARIGVATATRVPKKAALEELLLLLLAMAKCVWELASANDDAMAAVLIVASKRERERQDARRSTHNPPEQMGELQRNAKEGWIPPPRIEGGGRGRAPSCDLILSNFNPFSLSFSGPPTHARYTTPYVLVTL